MRVICGAKRKPTLAPNTATLKPTLLKRSTNDNTITKMFRQKTHRRKLSMSYLTTVGNNSAV